MNDTSIVSNSNKMLKSAIAYAAIFKWPVFPCNGKTPITPNGFKDATTDSEVIRKWWTTDPNANIGIPTGAASGFFAVDIDPRHGGQDSWDDINANYTVPDTIEAITGGRGRHILFKYPDQTIKNRANLFPGIDIRGEGGYIIVAPSIHESGNIYEWELSSHPSDTALSEAPDWLLSLLIESNDTSKPAAKAPDYWRNMWINTKEGSRDNNAYRLACYLLRQNIHEYLVFDILTTWNSTNVDPPLPTDDISRIFNSACGWELNRRKKYVKR